MEPDLRTEAFEGHTPGPLEIVKDVAAGWYFFGPAHPRLRKDGQPYANGLEDRAIAMTPADARLHLAAPALLADRDRLAGELATWRAVADGLAKAGRDTDGTGDDNLDRALAAYDAALAHAEKGAR